MLPVQGAAHGEKARAENSNRVDPITKRQQTRFGRTPTFENARLRELHFREQHCKDERENAARAQAATGACPKCLCCAQRPTGQNCPGRKNAQPKNAGAKTSLAEKIGSGVIVAPACAHAGERRTPPELTYAPSMPRAASGFTSVLIRQGLRPTARHSAGGKSRPRGAAASAHGTLGIGEAGH